MIDIDDLKRRFETISYDGGCAHVYALANDMLAALKEQETKFRHAVGSWTAEVEQLEQERTTLRATIEEAPHRYGCNTYNHLYKDKGVEGLLCTCWKRKALE